MVSSCDIPSINLQPFFEDKGVVIGDTPTTEQMEAAATIHQACQKHGFVHVNNFGLSESFGERLFAASKDLFSVADKHDLVPWHPSHNTGYSPYKSESLNVNRPADLKEAFNVRFPPTSTNPSLSKTPMSFQEIVDDEFFRKLQTAAIRYSMACALALDLPIDFFSKTLKKFDQCTVRFLHYPPCDFAEIKATTTTAADDAVGLNKAPVRAGEHTDFGAFTFLFLKEGPMGLQVKSVEGGEVGGSAGGEEADGWKDVVVPSSPDDTNNHNKTGDENETTTATTSFGAIINTGAMLARWTNDHWKATAHRVVVPNAEIASQDRYSIAFFVDPDADEFIEVDPKFAGDGKCCYEPIRSRDFLSMKLNEMTLK
ncbi:2(OG)-Fe(II) oxygenase family oxidoreductase [Nitzschia inconspicua]|uniref:2(OG)-Fe(II) oxygenase family oxidoreductase n=1 Tax=Nitzschia inconspicua TaxID=303405 RepID=A0A9K3LHR0_9STRA|nr:2(OG)-Fe(II) oxygenase family oxidoreductase [Nitzschia inconspicua]